MPCHCDVDFSKYRSYPCSRIKHYDVNHILNSIFGLDNLSDFEENPSPSRQVYPLAGEYLQYYEARRNLGNDKIFQQYKSHLMRGFIIASNSQGSQVEVTFIPKVIEGKFTPLGFNNSRGAITNVSAFYRSIKLDNALNSNEQQWFLNAKTKAERDLIMLGKFGKMTLNIDKIIEGVGGLPGLYSPYEAPEYQNDIPLIERKAYCEQLLACLLSHCFIVPSQVLENDVKKEIKNSHNTQWIDNKNVLSSIFEYIDTLSLVNIVASVCPSFHKAILYDQETGSQIYGGRILNFCHAYNLRLNYQNIFEIKKVYNCSSWFEFYMLSGMVFLENFIHEIGQAIIISENQSNQYGGFVNGCNMKYLILDPTLLISNRAVNELLECKRKKAIAVGTNVSLVNIVMTRIELPSSFESLISSILYSPIINCNRKEFSVNFNKGLPLYMKYLNDMSMILENHPILSTTCPNQLRGLQYVTEMMIAKAKYFIEQSRWHYFETASDDLLLGLHFVLLNNYFTTFGVDFYNYLNFTTLLENRNQSNKSNLNACQFPDELSTDFLSLLLYGDITIPDNHQFNNHSIFINGLFNTKRIWEQNVREIQLFIEEHIVDLSKVLLSDCSIENYINFLKDCQMEFPTKQVDLLFHFHMLHSLAFYQDCRDIAFMVKNHRICFQNNQPTTTLLFSAANFH